jgi:uncharacterized membrane protein
MLQLNGKKREEVNGAAEVSPPTRVRYQTLTKSVTFPARHATDIKPEEPKPQCKDHDAFHKFADKFVELLSTPTAIIVQAGGIAAYLAVNTLAVTKHIAFDPKPFLLMNAAVSIWSALTASIILNSNRRQDCDQQKQTAELKEQNKRLEKLVTEVKEIVSKGAK